tara:strand:- start:134263 stop:134826 length:564 start_codon:yes stop_codon:yes gene_type:complete
MKNSTGKKITAEKLFEIFYSGNHAFRGDTQVIQDIYFLIENNYIHLQKEILGTKEEYQKLVREADLTNIDITGGSTDHVAIKAFASQKLPISFISELHFCGFFPDLISRDKKIVVECGNTQNPEKIFSYFLHGVEKVIQIPYSSIEDKEIVGYSFSPQKDFEKFYKLWKQSELDKLKQHSSLFKNDF